MNSRFLKFKSYSVVICGLLLTHCGSSSEDTVTPATATNSSTQTGGSSTLGTGSNTASFSTLSYLPRAVDGVQSTSSLRLTASSGLPFATAADDGFGGTYDRFINNDNLANYFTGGSSTGSYAACETLNFARGAYGQVGGGDLNACLISKAVGDEFSANEFIYRSFSIDFDDEQFFAKIKLRKLTDDDGNLKAVEMFMCEGSSAQDLKQSEYYSQDFTGTDGVKIVIKGDATPDNSQVDRVIYHAVVTATAVGASGELQGTKSLLYRYRNEFSNNNGGNHVIANITQTEDTFTYNGMSCEFNSLSSTSCDARSGSQQLFAQAEILDFNETGERYLNNFALGDGASYLAVASSDEQGYQIWNGDTGSVANTNTSSAFYTYLKENIADLQEVTTEFPTSEVVFSEEESWDCEGEATDLGDSMLQIMGSCLSELEIDQDVHLECGNGPSGASLSRSLISP